MGLFSKGDAKPEGKHASKEWSTQYEIIARQEKDPRPHSHNPKTAAKRR